MNLQESISNFESTITLPGLLETIDKMGVGLTIVDARLKDLPLIYINQGFMDITGYSKEEVFLKNCRFLQGFDTNKDDINKLRRAIKEVQPETVTLKNYRKDGTYFWNQFIISPILDKESKPLYFIGLQFDVTSQVEEKQKSKQKVKELSHYDQLTGLFNLPQFKSELETILEKEAESGYILRINLNRFRNINNSLGEQVSNKVLIEVAERLKNIFTDSLISRSFADDYVVLKPSCDSYEVTEYIAALEMSLNKPYQLSGEEVYIDFSIGISKYPDNGKDVESLLTFASLAMKEAKNNYPNHHFYFNQILSEKLIKRMNIEIKFLKALENSEFFIQYQPKFEVTTEKLSGMEALIRWKDEELGHLSPAEFIPIAEETGFINELGEWVLLQSCLKNKEWQDEGLPKVPVSVNVSTVQFVHPHFIQMVQRILKKTGLDAQYLELEITESLLINPKIIISKLRELKKIGVLISIDDFGTGYSSISYLKSLPIDTLKVDRMFVMDTPFSKKDNALLSSIIQLGKSLGLKVLAEGVEKEEQVSYLKEIGCDYIQGFYYSRPLNEQDIEKKLKYAL